MGPSRRARIVRTIALLIVGGVAGPLVLAVATAAISRTDPDPAAPEASGFEYNKGQAADMLFRAYAPYRPPPDRFLTFDVQKPADWANCGYPRALDEDSDKLAPPLRAMQKMAKPAQIALRAYFRTLELAKQEHATIAKLDRTTSTFTAVFLRRCIEGTFARTWCVAEVTSRLDGDHWDNYPEGEDLGEHELRCHVFDGIAARNGLPLPKRSAATGYLRN